ncbi:hypothetical protein KSZ_65050 [Dictyobacter formicarum]|uniref:Uncharacterized protein n=1 Tax=Dictyobacter formicarum TaxID=2778368 RepID=A0ABQ3VQG2_9CHLR|nr:hypothetical protein KSZ_65050 [Dictyobacter formicarum]
MNEIKIGNLKCIYISGDGIAKIITIYKFLPYFVSLLMNIVSYNREKEKMDIRNSKK